MRQSKGERALGPYKHGSKWRVVFVSAAGTREVGSYASEAEALQERDSANIESGTRTVNEALAMYLQGHKTRPGYETTKHRLHALLRVDESDRPLVALTSQVAAMLYAARTKATTRGGKAIAAATQQGELRYARQFGAWCVAQGWILSNPFAQVPPVGEVHTGKPRLRVNGTRAYLSALMADTSMEATAVLTALTLKLRASAVVNRVVDDLDDDGRILWVRGSKTKASDLEIELPDFLRARLLPLAEGKARTERLFGEMTRYALYYHTVKFCRVAGVDRVTPHGLRGSGATQAVRSGEAIERVVKEIGHADNGTTLRRHYLGGGAVESGHARYIERLVMNGAGSVPTAGDGDSK